ncbi:hypothetical protein Q9233_015714 [Columba guinea]|nr:hypothetical protein Q9233_015714 [Columba guinea]
MAAGRWRAGLALLAVAMGLGGPRAEQTEEHLKREHSLSKPYQGVGSASSGLWDLQGNAMVMTQYIRLTPDLQSKQGAVWNRVSFSFLLGPVFGSKDNFLGLGVFVDTYPNEEKQQEAQKRRYSPGNQRVFPYISAMVNNGSLTYDHDRDGRPTELGGCTAMVRNLNHDTFLVIRYVKRRLTAGFSFPVEAPLEPMSGLALFLIVFFSLVAIVFAIVIGVIVYNKWQEQSRKHFY